MTTKQILTIAVEEYFHVAAFRQAVRRKHWDRLDPRLDASMTEILDLLDRHRARATFFVFGCIAESSPEIVERIVSRGHEVASRGFLPGRIEGMSRGEFLDDLHRAKAALERAGSNPIVGYRAPSWISEGQLWMLDLLAEQGYAYDSSVNPVLRRFAHHPEHLRVHRHVHADGKKTIWEFPIATTSLLGLRIAISGGNYIRQLPHTILSRAVAHRTAHDDAPVVFYFMPWELDRHQPQIQGITPVQRLRHYRNLAKTRWVLEDYLRRYEFQGIADYLGIAHDAPPAPPSDPGAPASVPAREGRAASEPPGPDLRPVTLVVPIYNEAQNISYLRRTLADFRRRLRHAYRMHLVLVDDRSTDDTWALLNQHFGGLPDTTLVRREQNGGVAAAILTGVENAPTEIVCTIDADCSYDPYDLEQMIPMIDSADMVTASPYHPEGHVLNVPEWRLLLSKTLSRMYSVVLDERFYTYTSCCRVVRKSKMEGIEIKHGGFLGPAEMLIGLKLRGGRIVEYPATLESRLFGESKMKIARTIMGHLQLLGEVVTTPELRRKRAPDRSGEGEQR